jgi:hypothetical protein
MGQPKAEEDYIEFLSRLPAKHVRLYVFDAGTIGALGVYCQHCGRRVNGDNFIREGEKLLRPLPCPTSHFKDIAARLKVL